MPDERHAADEHALLAEVTEPLSGLPPQRPALTPAPDFPIVLRGYDRMAVDAYVRRTSEVVAELSATHSPDAAVRRALERVGEQIAGILQRAHDTATQVTSDSRREAEDRLIEARREAEAIVAAARARLEELDVETDRVWAERERIVEEIRVLAQELLRLSESAAVPAEGDGPEPSEPGFGPPEPGEPGFEPRKPPGPALQSHPPPVAAADPDATAPLAPRPPVFDAEDDEPDPDATTVLPRPKIPDVRTIDLHHLGRERVIAAYLVDGVIIDPGPSSCLPTLLEALGDEPPRALLLTHIHLDHAGATGSLVRRWPALEVYVHERGAPHMIDPRRLIESASRLYGADMDRLWGEFVAVPEERLRVLTGGERLLDGHFTVAYTPGHASHHVSYLHEGTAFVGDVGGVRITDTSLTIPPTPPPDIDLKAWRASLDIVRQWRPERLAATHFGITGDVAAQLAEVEERLGRWGAFARHHERDAFIEMVRSEIVSDAGEEIAAAYVQAAAPDQLYAGLERYWRKHAELEPTADGERSQVS